MATPAAAPSVANISSQEDRFAALSKLEALSEELNAHSTRKKSNRYLRRAIRAWRKGDLDGAGRAALRATEIDEGNPKAYHMLGMYLERMGHKHKALVTYEQAFRLDPADPELLVNLGLTASDLKMQEEAIKMFRLYIAAKPDSAIGYNNLGTILAELGKTEEAIETLRAAIYRMPNQSVLWNSLATVLAEDGRAEESVIFYNEAIRLDPGFARLYHNLGYALQHLGRLEEAMDCYASSLKHAVDPTEIREAQHSRSICLMGLGRLEEGFREYEIRRHERFRSYAFHFVEAPYWEGEPLAGKRILIVGEQGLGDELMFANILPDLARAVGPEGKLQIALDPRLVSLYQRSFPQAEVGEYSDRAFVDDGGQKPLRIVPFAMNANKPDYWALMGSPLAHFRKHIEDFPHQAFLKPDPARVAEYRQWLAAGGSGPSIGICWRSMKIDARRRKYYSGLDMWGPILKSPGVRFINLQYGDCADEIAEAEKAYGVKIEVMPELNLKQDIEGAAALSAAVDLMISAPTASAAIAASVGTETWFLTADRAWPQLGTEEYPWYRKTRAFTPSKSGDWAELAANVAKALAGRVWA